MTNDELRITILEGGEKKVLINQRKIKEDEEDWGEMGKVRKAERLI